MVPWSHENGEYYLQVNKAIQYAQAIAQRKKQHMT